MYWKIRRTWYLLGFQFKKRQFKTGVLLRDSAKKTSIFGHVIGAIFWRLTFSIIFVVLLSILDRLLRNWNPHWLHFTLDKEAQREYFATLGGVSAAFLTLYFTAISVVVSTAYARTPSAIRSLIIREEAGSLYFGVLTQFAGVVTVILTALSFGKHIGPLNTCFVSFLCLFAIFGFVVIGFRVFSYFDPAILASHLNYRISKEILSVTPTGHQWTDQSFQTHHQNQVEEMLGSYFDLVKMASQKENLNDKGLAQLGDALLNILHFYTRSKARIPSSSLWFKRSYKHKNWLLTSYSEVEMALITGTSIQPDAVPDFEWFEAQVAKILVEIFHKLDERSDFAGTITLATNLQNHLGAMSQCLTVSESLHIFKAVTPKLQAQIELTKFRNSGSASSQNINRFIISELYSCGLIKVLLGFANELLKLNPESLGDTLKSVNWKNFETLYKGNILPRTVIQEMESLRDCFEFETRLEGKIISPDWLQNEMVAFAYVQFLYEVTKTVVGQFETTFGSEVEALLSTKDYALAAQVIQRGLEACEKLAKHFINLKALHVKLEALNRSKEYKWPKIDWDSFDSQISGLRDRLVAVLAQSSMELANLPESESWPDFFGHAYSVLAEECFSTMESGKDELFKMVFVAFFGLALQATDKLRKQFLGDIQNIHLAFEPMADLMALSGYAALFSELDDKQYWVQVQQYWNNYFKIHPDADSRQQFIKILCVAVEPNMRIAARSVLRTRWQQMFGRVLCTRGVVSERTFYDDQHRIGNHHSILIRQFSRSQYLLTDAHDVFLTLYIFKRPDAAGIDKPNNVEYLERALKPEADNED